jgi:putative flippase GtrA
VQLGAYAIDFGSFVLGVAALRAAPIVVNVIAKILAGTFAFLMHRTFTFGSTGSVRREALRYFVLLGANVPLSTVLFLVASWSLAPMTAKLAADAAGIVVTFWLVQNLVFRNRRLGDAL